MIADDTLPVRYFEDFAPGQIATTGEVAVTEADMIRFATEFDPQPMHTDPEAAQAITGGLIASGWHTASLTMRLLITGRGYRPAPGTLGLGFEELRWHRPVRPGDRLRLQVELLATRASATRPDQGIITSRFTTLNQRDEIVQTMTSSAMVPRRPVTDQADLDTARSVS
ncbi:MaoC family dehydratase [Acidiphilium iwatense]|uniref:MaoC family dehydratase n=1 Tax=Acidiphilium iwatense TaxID=768198 RepID=A0ABS9DV22_9PROT|nr:MaoC family dehydratase [Acidiphilium iwatense]MCF3945978.1 MaoC family dehydratase [Acidiphilium iwatense]